MSDRPAKNEPVFVCAHVTAALAIKTFRIAPPEPLSIALEGVGSDVLVHWVAFCYDCAPTEDCETDSPEYARRRALISGFVRWP